jgi:hypothetical protein
VADSSPSARIQRVLLALTSRPPTAEVAGVPEGRQSRRRAAASHLVRRRYGAVTNSVDRELSPLIGLSPFETLILGHGKWTRTGGWTSGCWWGLGAVRLTFACCDASSDAIRAVGSDIG